MRQASGFTMRKTASVTQPWCERETQIVVAEAFATIVGMLPSPETFAIWMWYVLSTMRPLARRTSEAPAARRIWQIALEQALALQLSCTPVYGTSGLIRQLT